MKRPTTVHNFGKRLSELRKSRGITQVELAGTIGVSNRVIAYYEGETKYPPAHLLIPIAKTLRMSLDELMGIKEESLDHNPQFANIWRRLKKTEQLPKKDQKALLHFMDALLAKNKD